MNARLYERAAREKPALAPLWHVGQGCSVFAGPLEFNDRHTHSVPVFIAGLYGAFRIMIGSEWMSCRTAVVPAGVPYALDVGGKPLAVIYLEPSFAGASALAPLVGDGEEIGGVLVGRRGETAALRELYEDAAGASWAGEALSNLMAFGARRERSALDARIRDAAEWMHQSGASSEPVADAARRAGLSSSRFQHLFSTEMGVPFRRYRKWQRLRAAIGEVIAGSNFTGAAHAAGFFDQAHFAREFRRTFGAPASRTLSDIRA